MELNKIRKYLGFSSVLIFLIALTLAILNYPNYNPSKNYLSDLGVGEESGFFFNYGLILAGLLGLIFSIISMFLSKNSIEKISYLIFLLANFFLILVGIFTEANELHIIVSAAFFSLSALAFLVFAIRQPYSLIAAVPIILLLLFGLIPILEHVAVLSISVWVIIRSI